MLVSNTLPANSHNNLSRYLCAAAFHGEIALVNISRHDNIISSVMDRLAVLHLMIRS